MRFFIRIHLFVFPNYFQLEKYTNPVVNYSLPDPS